MARVRERRAAASAGERVREHRPLATPSIDPSAGNRAFGRLLRAWLQRQPIEIENLSIAADTEGRGKSKKAIRGSRIPHMELQYWLPNAAAPGGPPTQQNYSVEEWVNGTVQTATANVPASQDLRPAIGALVDRATVVNELDQWSCDDTLMKSLVQTFVIGAAETPKWFDPGAAAGDRVQFNVSAASLATAGSRKLMLHLLTLRAAAHWRANTMKLLNREDMAINVKRGKQQLEPIKLSPDWAALTKSVRTLVKRLLNEEVATRGSRVPPKVSQRSTLDDQLVTVLRNDQKLGVLATRGHVEMQQDGTWKFFTTRKNGTETSTLTDATEDGLSQALRHLRFLAYLEWRAGYELLANAT